MKAKAVAKAGTPANASLYLAHVDDYLAKVDKLDDATRAQFGSDYAFIFQYLYPRVYELRGTGAGTANDLIAQLTGLAGTGGTGSSSGGSCTYEYHPVCATKVVQCFQAPCPGVRQTY